MDEGISIVFELNRLVMILHAMEVVRAWNCQTSRSVVEQLVGATVESNIALCRMAGIRGRWMNSKTEEIRMEGYEGRVECNAGFHVKCPSSSFTCKNVGVDAPSNAHQAT
jgi:hypothetical protein